MAIPLFLIGFFCYRHHPAGRILYRKKRTQYLLTWRFGISSRRLIKENCVITVVKQRFLYRFSYCFYFAAKVNDRLNSLYICKYCIKTSKVRAIQLFKNWANTEISILSTTSALEFDKLSMMITSYPLFCVLYQYETLCILSCLLLKFFFHILY